MSFFSFFTSKKQPISELPAHIALNSYISFCQQINKNNQIQTDQKDIIYRYLITSLVNEIQSSFTDLLVSSSYPSIPQYFPFWENCPVCGNKIGLSVNTEKKLKIQLGQDPVITFPWNRDRFIDNLSYIGSDVNNPFKFTKTNDYSNFLKPLNITVVTNGNHSINSAIFKHEGYIIPNEIYDLSNTYNQIKFDGKNFIHTTCGQILSVPFDYRFGIIYEIGRFL